MPLHILEIAGVLAGVVNFAGFIPYLRDILRHKTQPERAMWWIYSVLFTVLFVAQKSSGATWLLVATAVYVITSLLIAILSIKYGFGRLHRRDVISFGIAAIGLMLWGVTKDPLIAILMVIVVDFAGFWLTLVKTWHAPHSETLLAWQLALASAVFSLFSIGSLNFSLIIYPLYALIANALLVWLIIYRRREVKVDVKDF